MKHVLCTADECGLIHAQMFLLSSWPSTTDITEKELKKSIRAVPYHHRTLDKGNTGFNTGFKHFVVLEFFGLSYFFQTKTFQFLLISLCIQNSISLTAPLSLAVSTINTFVLRVQLLQIIRHKWKTWRARMKDKRLVYALWQLLRRPSVPQAYVVLIKSCTIPVNSDPNGQED